jgi:hypothetical protein
MPRADLFDGQVMTLRSGECVTIRRCEPMPKGLALYRLTPEDGPNKGHLEFALTEREIGYNAVLIGQSIQMLRSAQHVH